VLDAVYNSLTQGIALTDEQKSFLDKLGITAEQLTRLLAERERTSLKSISTG
jgi:hypothetical protein